MNSEFDKDKQESVCGDVYMPRTVSGAHTPVELYEILYGVSPKEVRLAASGGDRVYCRLESRAAPTVIGTVGTDRQENRAFVGLTGVFRGHGISVPQVLLADREYGCYLQTDLGDESLLNLLQTEQRMALSKLSLSNLVRMQTIGKDEWLPYVYASPFSRRMVMWDLNYFKYEFVKPCGVTFDEDKLEDDFEKLGESLIDSTPSLWGFMYRDFQSRNIIVKEGAPYFIDYQGGRFGPCLYDAVSFLWQAKAGFTREERSELLAHYASEFGKARGVEAWRVLSDVGRMSLLRTLQVLGAYGFRGLVEKRAHFIESIPAALSNLSDLMSQGEIDCYPELREVCRRLVESRYAESGVKSDGLTVKVFSFSYKKGYPEDLSGNGGGFMFDCRGLHNPGRYDRYKPLTGRDKEVIDFLEESGEVGAFLDNAYKMVAPSVSRYHERGFNSLQVGFGCTGGRHRSVYCAQNMAERLASNFPEVRIELLHREQGITELYNDKKK